MATAGYTIQGGSSYQLGPGSFYNPPGAMITMPVAGDITKITAYVSNNNSSTSGSVRIYTGSAGNRGSSIIAVTSNATITTTPQFLDFPFSSVFGASSTTYWLEFNGTGGNGPGGNTSQIAFDTGGPTDTGYTLSDVSVPQYNTNKYTLYATYNAAAASDGWNTALV